MILEDLYDLFLGNLESGEFSMADLATKLPPDGTSGQNASELFRHALQSFGIGAAERNFWGAVRKRMQPLVAGEMSDPAQVADLRAGLGVLQKLFHNHDPRERLVLIVNSLPVPRQSI